MSDVVTSKPSSHPDVSRMLNIDDLASVLNLSPASVRRWATMRPDRLPRRLDIGFSTVLWHPAEVNRWLSDPVYRAQCKEELRRPEPAAKRGRGRPRKYQPRMGA